MRLLHVIGSPSGENSRSRAVAETFIEAWLSRSPGGEVDVLDVWRTRLPEFDADMIAAKFAVLRGTSATPEQQRLWGEAIELARRFNTADRYVFSVPMWNFGLPYRLKHFIDVATLPEQNWRWHPDTGYQSLLKDRRALLIYTSAGAHRVLPDESSNDHQKGQMRAWLSFLGIVDLHEIAVAPTLAPAEQVTDTTQRAMERLRLLADTF